MFIIFSGLPARVARDRIIGGAMEECVKRWGSQYLGNKNAVTFGMTQQDLAHAQGACVTVSDSSFPGGVQLRGVLVCFARSQLLRLVPKEFRALVVTMKIVFE